MAIANSTYTLDNHRQVDGRIYVTERHTDDAGGVHDVTYLAPAAWGAAEYTATMTARAAQIAAELAEAELSEAINGA